jgi:hypothetical protein
MDPPNGPVVAQFYNTDTVSYIAPTPQAAAVENPAQVLVIVTTTITTCA